VRPFDLTAEYHTRRKFTTGKKGPVTRGILPHFRSNKEGVIIKVGSGAGILTLPMISLYCASKFALEGFSKALAYELASQNIVVKLVEPHGGVASTSFNERSARDQALRSRTMTNLSQRPSDAFARMSAARMLSAEDVAKVIYGAATDGTDQLRYLVGNDTRGFIKARQEMSEQDYVTFMRSWFLPKK